MIQSLPAGLRWDTDRDRLKVCAPELAEIVLRDPHIITGVDHSGAGAEADLAAFAAAPTVEGFFRLWYTVGDNYAPFNSELRKAFTTRVVHSFTALFDDLARAHVDRMPVAGDLARDYLAPYFMDSTFAMLGVPERDWPNLTKVARLVIHLFKQQLLGVTEHSDREVQAFRTVIAYLKDLTDRLLRVPPETPFLRAAHRLSALDDSTWPIAALIGQLLMAGIEPMVVGASVACVRVWGDDELRHAVRVDAVDAVDMAEEVLRQNPPFGNVFRFVRDECDCLGVRLEPGTVVAIDVTAVNLATRPAHDPARGCPVRHSELLTFGKGAHYCLGANSARLQVAAAVRALAAGRPDLRVDHERVRIDTDNNLREVRSLPYHSETA